MQQRSLRLGVVTAEPEGGVDHDGDVTRIIGGRSLNREEQLQKYVDV